MAEEKSLLDEVQEAPAGFKVSPGWRVGHLKEETITKSGPVSYTHLTLPTSNGV